MKFTLAQLNKFYFPYSFSEDMNLSDDLEGIEDILKVLEVKVTGIITSLYEDCYKIDFTLHAKLILECAASLKEVPYTIDTTFSEKFSIDKDDEDAFLIEGQTLDTKEAIITNLLISKPAKVYAEGENFISDEEVKEEKINPAFKSLKDLL